MATPTPPAPAPAVGGSLAAKVGGPRNLAILGAGLTVALVALIALRKNSSTASGTVTTDTSDTAFDSGPYDMWNQWQEEYEGLQQQINAQQSGQTSVSGPGTPAAPPPVPIARPPLPPRAPWGNPPLPKPTPTPTPTPVKPAAHKTITVKSGDTLSAIAAKAGISMTTLKRLNPVYWTNPKYKQGNMIWSGDKVKVS